MKLRKLIKQNKKAQISNIIFMIFILFLFLFVGFGLVFGGVVIEWVFDEAFPEISSLGMIGNANMTQNSDLVLKPINNIVQNFKFMTGVLYFMGLAGLIGIAVSFRMVGNKWLIAFFFMAMLLLIIASIFISNIYEEFYNDGSEVGERLHTYALMSWLILYSPLVMTIIGFVAGIIMFTGEFGEGGYV